MVEEVEDITKDGCDRGENVCVVEKEWELSLKKKTKTKKKTKQKT